MYYHFSIMCHDKGVRFTYSKTKKNLKFKLFIW